MTPRNDGRSYNREAWVAANRNGGMADVRRGAVCDMTAMHALFAVGMVVVLSGCGKGRKDGSTTAAETGVARPDLFPAMLNKEMPFRYPPALYAEKVQGNVTLRLYIDTGGVVVQDSTRVVESSRSAMLDSAAMNGSRELRFSPAKSHGVALPVSILFPIYFRHPEAAPPAGDTILKRGTTIAADSAPSQIRDTVSHNRPAAPKRSSGTRHRHK